MHGKSRRILAFFIRPRTIAAFIIAPVSPALILGLVAMLFDGKIGESMLVLYMLALICYPVAFVLGVPLIAFLQYRNWNGLVGYGVFGIILGLLADLPYLPFYETSPSGEPQFSLKLAAENPGLIGFGIICSMFATVVFWLIARPDRIRSENVSGV